MKIRTLTIFIILLFHLAVFSQENKHEKLKAFKVKTRLLTLIKVKPRSFGRYTIHMKKKYVQ